MPNLFKSVKIPLNKTIRLAKPNNTACGCSFMKAKSITLAGSKNSPFMANVQNSDEVAFDLYLKNRELKQINSFLREISLWDRQIRLSWLADNQDVLDQLVDSFMEDSSLVFHGIKLQGEALQLSVELVTSLREAMTVIRSLVKTTKNAEMAKAK